MPYTVAVSFDRFFENINLSGDHHDIARARRDRLVSLLEKHFTILEAFPTGSIPRFTAVTGHADLDIMVALHYGKHIENKTPAQVLQSVRDALSEYRTNVRKNGQAVTLGYETWPDVDVVPVSRSVNESGATTHYNVPDMNRGVWIESRPKTHSNAITAKNTLCGASFKKLVKMIKWWNHQHSSLLQSYHIEVMALKICSGPLNDFSWDVYCYFKEAATLAESYLWHDGSFADDYLDWQSRPEVVKRLCTARDKALSAWHATYGTNDDHKTAIGLWKQIFGDKFPAYGS